MEIIDFNEILDLNLKLIDGSLPRILAEMLKTAFSTWHVFLNFEKVFSEKVFFQHPASLPNFAFQQA